MFFQPLGFVQSAGNVVVCRRSDQIFVSGDCQPICMGCCCNDVGVSHCLHLWQGFPTLKHEQWRPITSLSKESCCQVTEQTTCFGVIVYRLWFPVFSSDCSAAWILLSHSHALLCLWTWHCFLLETPQMLHEEPTGLCLFVLLCLVGDQVCLISSSSSRHIH